MLREEPGALATAALDARPRDRRRRRPHRADPHPPAAQARRVRAEGRDHHHRRHAARLLPARRGAVRRDRRGSAWRSPAIRMRATASRCASRARSRWPSTTTAWWSMRCRRSTICSSRPRTRARPRRRWRSSAGSGCCARPSCRTSSLIEDDYEAENLYAGTPMPALKSLDKSGRVIYIGSVSKSLSPALRLGYIVAPRALVKELRVLRHAMVRHPSAFLQHAYALFLSLGHHESHARRVNQAMQERVAARGRGVARRAAGFRVHAAAGRRLDLGAGTGLGRCRRARRHGARARRADRSRRRVLRQAALPVPVLSPAPVVDRGAQIRAGIEALGAGGRRTGAGARRSEAGRARSTH